MAGWAALASEEGVAAVAMGGTALLMGPPEGLRVEVAKVVDTKEAAGEGAPRASAE